MPIVCRQLVVEDGKGFLLLGRFAPVAVLCLPAHFVLGLFGCLFEDVFDNQFTKLQGTLGHCEKAVLASVVVMHQSVDSFSELASLVYCFPLQSLKHLYALR
jgi:hypothetical protein